MDIKLLQALNSLYRSIKQRSLKTSEQDSRRVTAIAKTAEPMQVEDVYKANLPEPSPRDQQDLMAFPFFSLEKSKRTEPIIYEHGDIKVTVRGLVDIGIATIWDADLLIWAASQLNAAIERGEMPTRRLWIVPYQFLIQTRRMSPKTKGNRARLRFKDCLRRLQGTTIETTIKAGGKEFTETWSWIDRWRTHEENGRLIGVDITLSEWFFYRVCADRAVLAIHADYFLLTGGIERWLYRIARKHCGNNMSGWSFTLFKLYEKYPPGREFRFFKRDIKIVVKSDCLPEYNTTWETSNGVDWIHFSLRQNAAVERSLPRSLRQ